MALALREASWLKPDLRLAQAVSEFEATLTSEQKVSFRASRTAAASNGPTMSDVMRLTAEIDLKTTSRHGRGRCFGPRLTNMLEAIQKFAALGDIVVGGSQNLIACGVWAAARMTVHVATGYLTYLEKLSALFMVVGRNAPRHHAMGAIYPQSKNLQRYLCEYFIIVTKICHQSIIWTQKSSISRLSSTISDPELKDFQSDLDGWSAAIKEEANLLLNQRVDEEVKESAKFRSLAKFGSETSAHQQNVRKCIRFLEACSQYDYQTTWKQTRKCGTTCLLQSCYEYRQWKEGKSENDSILFRGKLGAGKSVLLANIVSDLNLQSNTITLYFFARHDNSESLKARTILGSLIRQLLENFVAHSDFDHIFVEKVSQLDLDDVVEIFRRVPPHDRRVYIILDGLDECEVEEQRKVLQHLSWIQSINYKLCLSVRTSEQNAIWRRQSFQFHAAIPEKNPDISDYVQVGVDSRVRDGTLVARDPGLIQDIKRELIDGADGMFLWVSLQLDSLCDELSDDDIREAIHDLPRDLTETFERNLKKASSRDSKGHHIRIFKLLVSARQLLTTEELREAASVTVGRAIWNPNQHISDIHSALKFCGSLVMIDEEDDTVRFIHHSARSFCLNSPRNAAQWTFTEDEAEKTMAETVVTYLSYNVFDTRLSRNVIPKIDADSMPQKVMLSTMNKHTKRTNVAGRFLSFRSRTRHDIGPVLAEASSSRWKDNTQQFFFLSYAKDNWIHHTSHLEDLSSVPHWHHLLDHPTFGVDTAHVSRRLLPSSRAFLAPSDLLASPHMTWAVCSGHILLLKHELTKDQGVRRIQAYAKLWMLLRRIKPQSFQDMDYHLVRWLSPMFVSLRMNHPAKPYLLTRLSVFDECYVRTVQDAISLSDTDAVTALLQRDDLEQSQLSLASPPLIEVAVSSGNTSISHLLVERGIARDRRVNGFALIRAITSDLPDPVIVRLVHSLFLAGIDLNTLSDSQLYLSIKLLCNHASFDKVSMVLQGLFTSYSRLSSRRDDLILHKACMRGDMPVASILLSRSRDPDTSISDGSYIEAALYGISQDRLSLVWHLLKCLAHPSPAAVARAIQLRQWAFALCFLSYQTESGHSNLRVNDVDWDDIYLAVISRPTLGASVFIYATPGLAPLPVYQRMDRASWHFYFTANVYREDKWKVMDEDHRKNLCQAIETSYDSTHAFAPRPWYKNSRDALYAPLTQFDQPLIELVKAQTFLTHVLKANIPNPLTIVERVSARWGWLYDDENCLSLEDGSPIEGSSEISHATWNSLDRSDDLGLLGSHNDFYRRQMLINQRCRHNYNLLQSGLADAQWAVRGLTQTLGFLQSLQPLRLSGTMTMLPVLRLPSSRQWHFKNVRNFSFCFAYMSIRIQWLRIVGLLYKIRLSANITISQEFRSQLGDMAEIWPRAFEAHRPRAPSTNFHYIMPSTLEAAFLGREGRHILEKVIRNNNQWVSEVDFWIRQMDTGIFTWAMGEDAPLSFERAFESFRKAGASQSEMEALEQALEIARAKVAELE